MDTSGINEVLLVPELDSVGQWIKLSITSYIRTTSSFVQFLH